jgi:hypothetical protein
MEIDNEFQLPIYYLKNKQEISNHISNDLELEDTSDISSLYRIVFDPKSLFATSNISLWNKYYTSDTLFLKDTQKLTFNNPVAVARAALNMSATCW